MRSETWKQLLDRQLAERRIRLISALDRCDWKLPETAELLGTTKSVVRGQIRRIEGLEERFLARKQPIGRPSIKKQ